MSSTSVNPIPCSICGEGGHRASNCDSLGIPPHGFSKNEGGYREEGGDDDEHLSQSFRLQTLDKIESYNLNNCIDRLYKDDYSSTLYELWEFASR